MGEEGLAPNNESPHETRLSTLVGQYVGQNRRQITKTGHPSVDTAIDAFTLEVVSLAVQASPVQREAILEAIRAILAEKPACSSNS